MRTMYRPETQLACRGSTPCVCCVGSTRSLCVDVVCSCTLCLDSPRPAKEAGPEDARRFGQSSDWPDHKALPLTSCLRLRRRAIDSKHATAVESATLSWPWTSYLEFRRTLPFFYFCRGRWSSCSSTWKSELKWGDVIFRNRALPISDHKWDPGARHPIRFIQSALWLTQCP